MTTYWGFHCKTCPQTKAAHEDDFRSAYSEHWMNHGEHVLRAIVRLTPELVAIRDGDDTGYIEMSVLGYGYAPISWAIEHAGHDIELHNEYGRTEPINET